MQLKTGLVALKRYFVSNSGSKFIFPSSMGGTKSILPSEFLNDVICVLREHRAPSSLKRVKG